MLWKAEWRSNMFPLTADTAFLFPFSHLVKSLPFAEAMHYVLFCSKVNTHTRIYTNNLVAGKKERKKKKEVLS